MAVVLTSVGFTCSVFAGFIQQEELMWWHPSRVTRTRIWVIGGNFQWVFDQGKGILVWVGWEFELSELKLTE